MLLKSIHAVSAALKKSVIKITWMLDINLLQIYRHIIDSFVINACGLACSRRGLAGQSAEHTSERGARDQGAFVVALFSGSALALALCARVSRSRSLPLNRLFSRPPVASRARPPWARELECLRFIIAYDRNPGQILPSFADLWD